MKRLVLYLVCICLQDGMAQEKVFNTFFLTKVEKKVDTVSILVPSVGAGFEWQHGIMHANTGFAAGEEFEVFASLGFGAERSDNKVVFGGVYSLRLKRGRRFEDSSYFAAGFLAQIKFKKLSLIGSFQISKGPEELLYRPSPTSVGVIDTNTHHWSIGLRYCP